MQYSIQGNAVILARTGHSQGSGPGARAGASRPTTWGEQISNPRFLEDCCCFMLALVGYHFVLYNTADDDMVWLRPSPLVCPRPRITKVRALESNLRTTVCVCACHNPPNTTSRNRTERYAGGIARSFAYKAVNNKATLHTKHITRKSCI